MSSFPLNANSAMNVGTLLEISSKGVKKRRLKSRRRNHGKPINGKGEMNILKIEKIREVGEIETSKEDVQVEGKPRNKRKLKYVLKGHNICRTICKIMNQICNNY